MNLHPRLGGMIASYELLADEPSSWPVSSSEQWYSGGYASVRTDRVADSSGVEHDRLVVQPHGAVAVLALDEEGRVLLVQQYRHPIQMRLLELPAGTLDVPDEPPLQAAKRELAEEADLTAGEWTSLYRAAGAPGYSSEYWECFLATDLQPVAAGERYQRVAEEADMQQWWIDFDAALDAAAAGRISDAKTLAGLWALYARRTRRP